MLQNQQPKHARCLSGPVSAGRNTHASTFDTKRGKPATAPKHAVYGQRRQVVRACVSLPLGFETTEVGFALSMAWVTFLGCVLVDDDPIESSQNNIEINESWSRPITDLPPTSLTYGTSRLTMSTIG